METYDVLMKDEEGRLQRTGQVCLPTGAVANFELERALSRLEIYAPRGQDRVKWTADGATITNAFDLFVVLKRVAMKKNARTKGKRMKPNGMEIVRDDLWFCDDCTMAAVNDDLSGVDFYLSGAAAERRKEEIWRGLEKFGPHLVSDSDAESGEGIAEFMSRRCDSCGGLPGSRHRFAVLGEMKGNAAWPPRSARAVPGEMPGTLYDRDREVLQDLARYPGDKRIRRRLTNSGNLVIDRTLQELSTKGLVEWVQVHPHHQSLADDHYEITQAGLAVLRADRDRLLGKLSRGGHKPNARRSASASPKGGAAEAAMERFEYWFRQHGHWIYRDRQQALKTWQTRGIEGLPPAPKQMTDQEFRDRIAGEVERLLGDPSKARTALIRYEEIWYSGDARTATPNQIAEQVVSAYRASPGPQLKPNTSTNHPIANSGDVDSWDGLWLFQFGAYGSTNVYVWADGLESAFEEAVEWLDDNAPGLLTTVGDEDYRNAAEELGKEWDPSDPDEEVMQAAEADMTMIGHTTLQNGNAVPSWEWHVAEVVKGSSEWKEVADRSREEEED